MHAERGLWVVTQRGELVNLEHIYRIELVQAHPRGWQLIATTAGEMHNVVLGGYPTRDEGQHALTSLAERVAATPLRAVEEVAAD